MNKTYLLLGSNMGNNKQQLQEARNLIKQNIGRITRQSKLYVTAAWGNSNQPDFLNQLIVVETELPATELIKTILSIEATMGRIRSMKNAPRIIDIDILFFNKEMIREKDLIVPHPEIQNRRFVLVPLNELVPGLKHPVLKKTIHQLLESCPDTLDVKKF